MSKLPNFEPKLDRPLSLQKPQDYLCLFYWIFFFPQAIRWYVKRFCKPRNQTGTMLSQIRQDPIQQALIIQAFIVTIVVILFVALLFRLAQEFGLVSIEINSLGVIVGLIIGIAIGITIGFVFGIEYGVAIGVAISTTIALVSGLAVSTAGQGDTLVYIVLAGVAVSVGAGVMATIIISLILSIISDNTTSLIISIATVLIVLLVGMVLVNRIPGISSEILLLALSSIVVGVIVGTIVTVGVSRAFSDTIGRIVGLATGMVVSIIVYIILGDVQGGLMGTITGTAIGIIINVASGVAGGIVVRMSTGLAIGMMVGLAFGWAGTLGYLLMLAISTLRFPEWLAILLLPDTYLLKLGRTTILPLPKFKNKLTQELSHDWLQGLKTVNQLLAYTMQFFYVVQVVNHMLEQSSKDQLLQRISQMTENPFDWYLIRCCSADLGQILGYTFVDIWPMPRGLNLDLQNRFLTDLRADTDARAASAGFWRWYCKDTEMAQAAFERVRQLYHGEELYQIALLLHQGTIIESVEELVLWQQNAECLSHLPDPPLRIGTLTGLDRLRQVSIEVNTAERSYSFRSRLAAFGRANAKLIQFLEEGSMTVPQPEWNIIEQIIVQWRDIVSRAGGNVDEEVLREPIRNPYEGYAGTPVVGPTFVGRQDVMTKIERHWTTEGGPPVLIVYGHRRMGKTSILRNLENHLPDKTCVVYLSMQVTAVLIDNTGDVLLDIASKIYDGLSQQIQFKTPLEPKDYVTLGSARRAFNHLLQEIDAKIGDRLLVLAMDEFEEVETQIEKGVIEPALLNYLRAVNQSYNWLALLFAGLHTLGEMGSDYQNAFYAQTEHIVVGYLTKSDTIKLVTQPHPDFVLGYSHELLDTIYTLTAGQPFLIQRLCWELVNNWNERFLVEGEKTSRVLEVADLEPVLNADFFKAAEFYFTGVWNNVTPEEQVVMEILAQEFGEWWSTARLSARSGKPQTEIEATLEKLRGHDVIPHEPKDIRIASELLRRWIAEIRPGEIGL